MSHLSRGCHLLVDHVFAHHHTAYSTQDVKEAHYEYVLYCIILLYFIKS